MSGAGAQSMNFRATPPEATSALRLAAKRAGLLYLSGDAAAGTAVYTAGRYLMAVGEKVKVAVKEVEPGTVRVTVSPGKLGVGWAARGGNGADRLCAALDELLPRAT
jgi:hypothetical protein